MPFFYPSPRPVHLLLFFPLLSPRSSHVVLIFFFLWSHVSPSRAPPISLPFCRSSVAIPVLLSSSPFLALPLLSCCSGFASALIPLRARVSLPLVACYPLFALPFPFRRPPAPPHPARSFSVSAFAALPLFIFSYPAGLLLIFPAGLSHASTSAAERRKPSLRSYGTACPGWRRSASGLNGPRRKGVPRPRCHTPSAGSEREEPPPSLSRMCHCPRCGVLVYCLSVLVLRTQRVFFCFVQKLKVLHRRRLLRCCVSLLCVSGVF